MKLLLLIFAAYLAVASSHAILKTGFPGLPCNYSVNQAPAISVTGKVPSYVNGSMYHALFGAGAVTTTIALLDGGVISVDFAPGNITASFGYTGGSRCPWRSEAKLEALGPFKDLFPNTNAVTISGDPRSDERIFSVSGPTEFAAMDRRSLETVENPVEFDGDSLGSDFQNWPAKLPGIPFPRFYAPAHDPTDANGDLYGMVYIFHPQPAYRIWRVSKATGKRTVLPDIPPSPQYQTLAKPGPAYVHQCMLFTPRFIIIPEIPMRMSLPPMFDYSAIQDSWMGNSTLNFKVLEKSTGKVLGNYAAPAAYSWHSINAFEDDNQIVLDVTWQQNYTALDVFTGRRHGMLWWYYQGKFARFSMPIPKLDGSQAGALPGTAALEELTKVGKPFVSPEFGVVHPGMMWREKTRYIWGLATSDDHKDKEWLPHAIKVDTTKPDETPLAYTTTDDMQLGAPVYVPSGEAGASEDDGALIMLKYNLSDAKHTYVVILDAASMTERVNIKLPILPASNIGLHNHYSQYPTEALSVLV